MDKLEIPYLLKRACAHRLLGQVAQCTEARSIHRTFVKNYQGLLLTIRRMRMPPIIRQETLKKQRFVLPDEIATMIADRKVG
ncbi:hypothetical protein [Flavisphingomonas formosensis]|uniref:hypothetical protein n=1 Tax=Flavisphingomonas formosensis TaxID=861534 RepID=UPI0012FB13F8|nr:hypothetical protein [Sphingomonas formosensis]